MYTQKIDYLDSSIKNKLTSIRSIHFAS